MPNGALPHHQPRRYGLAVLPPAGLDQLTVYALSAMAFNVGRVDVMCVCRRHMWAVKASRKGEGKRKEDGGETALTNTKR
jgi:hypothetical protein